MLTVAVQVCGLLHAHLAVRTLVLYTCLTGALCSFPLLLPSCFLLQKGSLEQVSFWIVCGVQVPPELKEDLILIADKIEPYLLQVKEQADKIPEKAHELAGKIQPAAEKLGDQIEQGASKVLSHARARVNLR